MSGHSDKTAKGMCYCGEIEAADAADRLAVLLDEKRTAGAVRLNKQEATDIQVALENAAGAHREACDCLFAISVRTPTEVTARVEVPTVDVPVRDENGWGRLRIETVPEYLADRERLTRALTSLANAWPYVAKHAEHIDGEYNSALDDVKRCVEWAIGISESVRLSTG